MNLVEQALQLIAGGGARFLENRFTVGAPIDPSSTRQCTWMLRLAAEPKRCISVTAPVSAAVRFRPACLSRNLAMTRWMMRSTGVSNSGWAATEYAAETARLYAVLNKHLADRKFIAGSYSIADMACYPWTVPHERQGQKLEDFPHLARWFAAIRERPATQRAYALAQTINPAPAATEEAKRVLFGQDASTVRSG